MTGRAYLDPGSRMSGRYDPPRRCIVLTRWGPGGGLPAVLLLPSPVVAALSLAGEWD